MPALMRGCTHSWRNAVCLLLVAAALMMRALVPGGMMVSTERGDLAITLCNSDMKLVIPMKDKVPSSDDDDRQQPCAFAGHAPADNPPAQFAPLPQFAAAAYDATRAQALSPDSPRFLPPPTGPPVHA